MHITDTKDSYAHPKLSVRAKHSKRMKVSAKVAIQETTAAQALDLPVLDRNIQGAALPSVCASAYPVSQLLANI